MRADGGNSMSARVVLEVKDLHTRFHTQDGTVHAVNGVSFNLHAGQFLGVVGESGSGKSVTMMSLLKLIPMPPGDITGGSAFFDGADLLSLDDDELKDVRGAEIGFIFQDPMVSLNPVLRVGQQISEGLRRHHGVSKKDAMARARELLAIVGIPDPDVRIKNYPYEMSGGMRQRVMIAIALACNPQMIIADEPTTALDVTVQAQIIEQFREMREDFGTAVIWITHDLAVVAGLVDRVMVMYGGRIVEEADVSDLYAHPQHPYTQGLLNSLPRLDEQGHDLIAIEGQPPNMLKEPVGCSFAPRCEHAFDRCWTDTPVQIETRPGHVVACHYDMDAGAPRS